jgi:anti-sigma regulatory factor (Ser/Thr protein kinase)
LSSTLKGDPAGFVKYYEERQRALDNLKTGFVEFVFEHVPQDDGGLLTISVVDSGKGFEFDDNDDNKEDNEPNNSLYGRGLPLIASLCRYVRHHGCGNQVEALFEWQREA